MEKRINNEIVYTDALLKLDNIKKDYILPGNDPVHALKGISISFRKNEFVSILGPSGCGKTTLLNIIGGLDKYSDGDLIISSRSTKNYSDRDWDIYRNHRIGFIFQSYNLIPHQTILENVELALTIAGYSKKERVEKAKAALDKVGLAGAYNKHGNQLSGGQCQRVAIARALVNEPEILLADEPTGALDTKTSKQIMDLICDISKEKLVIMVTHNPDIANQYSNRIINLLDGKVVEDSNPFKEKIIENKSVEVIDEKAKMSFKQAFKLSFRNLLSKFKRTLLVCIAGSIGIVGVSTVLAVSSGIHNYIDSMQDDMLSGNPITITETTYDLNGLMTEQSRVETVKMAKEVGYINVNSIVEYLAKQSNTLSSYRVSNDINEDYTNYIKNMDPEYYAAMKFGYGLDLSYNVYTDFKYGKSTDPKKMSISAITQMYREILNETDFKDYSSYITQLASSFEQAPNNPEYIKAQYDMLSDNGYYANAANEIMIVVSGNEELNDVLLAQLGYYTQEEFLNIVYKASDGELYKPENEKYRFSYNELVGKEFVWYPNNSIFTKNTGMLASYNPFTYKPYASDEMENGIKLKVTGILKLKEQNNYGCLSSGFFYTEALTNKILESNLESEIVKYYKDNETTTITSGPYQYGPTTIDIGVTYNLDYTYNGVSKTVKSYLGSEDTASTLMNMFKSYMGGGQGESDVVYHTTSIRKLGGESIPSSIAIYPTTFNDKYLVTDYLDNWNNENDITVNDKVLTKENRSNITYNDNLELIINIINTMIDIVTYALIVFTALALLVSTVMIGIITYVSVVERVKEIGVIRSLGGRKKDVSHLFNAETFIIGLTSGLLGILITELLSILINVIVGHFTGIYTIAALRLSDAIIMICVSIVLTLISGLIPARAAANKNPVDALRTE